jgi:adenosylcobyric acid synthase
VQLRWVAPGDALGQPDAVVVPGSKQTLRDLAALQSSGLGETLRRYAAAGGQVFAICGGLQLLGRELLDPEGLEGSASSVSSSGSSESTVSSCDQRTSQAQAGLNLLPLRTVFGGEKALRQRRSRALWPDPADTPGNHELLGQGQDLTLEGFELHRGSTVALEPCRPLCDDPALGWVQPVGNQGGIVAGTYLHGVFESGPWRRRWLNQLRSRRGLPLLSERQPHHSRQRDQLLDRLADAFEAHVNLEPLLRDR